MNISVIVTTYNWPEALTRVIQALNVQSRAPEEILIADDGSADETRLCIERLQQQIRIPLMHVWQPDRGFRAGHIRNQAVRNCTGDYIIFMDGDCIPDKYFIEDHCRLAEHGCFFQGKRVLVDRHLAATFSHHALEQSKLRLLLSPHLGNRHHLFRMKWLPAARTTKLSGIRSCNMALFKKDLYAVNGFNEAFQGWGREDSELAVRLYKYGLKRKEHPFAAVCFHLWHPEQDRSNLPLNDQLLKAAMDSNEYRCRNGLVDLKL